MKEGGKNSGSQCLVYSDKEGRRVAKLFERNGARYTYTIIIHPTNYERRRQQPFRTHVVLGAGRVLRRRDANFRLPRRFRRYFQFIHIHSFIRHNKIGGPLIFCTKVHFLSRRKYPPLGCPRLPPRDKISDQFISGEFRLRFDALNGLQFVRQPFGRSFRRSFDRRRPHREFSRQRRVAHLALRRASPLETNAEPFLTLVHGGENRQVAFSRPLDLFRLNVCSRERRRHFLPGTIDRVLRLEGGLIDGDSRGFQPRGLLQSAKTSP